MCVTSIRLVTEIVDALVFFMCYIMSSSIRWALNVKDWKPSHIDWDFAVQCVQKEEKERIYRYVYSDDAKASMIGQLLMRKASALCTNIPYNNLLFSRTDSGKPYISNYKKYAEKEFNFNISHNGDFCVIAGEQECAVGVDVMKTEYRGSTSLQDYFQLMKKQFSHEEMEFISCPGSAKEKLERFYRLWCLKESFVKARGTGIICDLSKISFCCSTLILQESNIVSDTKLILDGNPVQGWHFEETMINENHCAAVAVQNDCETSECLISSKRFKILTYSDLIQDSIPFEKLNKDDWNKFCIKLEKQKHFKQMEQIKDCDSF